jgi:hypothetical protein
VLNRACAGRPAGRPVESWLNRQILELTAGFAGRSNIARRPFVEVRTARIPGLSHVNSRFDETLSLELWPSHMLVLEAQSLLMNLWPACEPAALKMEAHATKTRIMARYNRTQPID